MLLKITVKNYSIVIYALFYCSTIYMVILSLLLLLPPLTLLLSLYHPSNWNNMDIDCSK